MTYLPSPVDWVREEVEHLERTGHGLDGRAVVLLTTIGARTGAVRKTPLMRVEHDGRYALVASQGGAPEHPSWHHNLLADPRVELQDGPAKQDMVARELSDDERAQWWRRSVEAFPPYREYQFKTQRQIPVWLLEPLTADD